MLQMWKKRKMPMKGPLRAEAEKTGKTTKRDTKYRLKIHEIAVSLMMFGAL